MTADKGFSEPGVMAPLWRAAELPALLGGRAQGGFGADISSISIDTRTLEPGALFFAIIGDVQDGHGFVAQALAKGAAAAVVSRLGLEGVAADAPLIVVPDVLAALEALGKAGRARLCGQALAVTGSVGKTSTKEMLRHVLAAHVLAQHGQAAQTSGVHASVASYNNHWGVPLTLARTPQSSAFAIYEIGMSAPFEILPLTAMVRPQVAIVTSVEPVHLAQFRALDGIADAKGEIFAGLEPGGVAVVPFDSPFCARLAAHAHAARAGRIVRFGEGAGAECRLVDFNPGDQGSVVGAELFGQRIDYAIGAPGKHFALNSLAVLCALHALGVECAQAVQALASFGTIAGRGAREKRGIGAGTFTLIDESYNANPASMRAALQVLGAAARHAGGRALAVLGDMRELGAQEIALHEGLATPLEAENIDLVLTAGPLMQALHAVLPPHRQGGSFADSALLAQALPELLHPGDCVMIKGSFGSKMALVVEALRARFARVDDAGTPAV